MNPLLRADLALVADWIAPHSRVLDLGCGQGELLAHLRDAKHCQAYGVEIDDANVLACATRHVNVIQQNLESGLALFADQSFDVVVQLETLQAMKNVEKILAEIARVGHEAIVSFPNFAYWQHRLQLARGSMPVSKTLPYEWYDTPNVRCATMRDFEALAEANGLVLTERVALHNGRLVKFMPNLFGSLALFRFKKA
jgi:methionine biosynthesis protein MetW